MSLVPSDVAYRDLPDEARSLLDKVAARARGLLGAGLGFRLRGP